jgi:hypothetical protein
METNMLRYLLAGAALVGALGAQPALAESYKFTLYNHSKYAIVGFETFENGQWSEWKDVGVDQDEHQVMDWRSAEGSCNVPFRIIYEEVQTEQYTVNWCKIKNIHVYNDRVTAD